MTWRSTPSEIRDRSFAPRQKTDRLLAIAVRVMIEKVVL
jgi:hypothetical protein